MLTITASLLFSSPVFAADWKLIWTTDRGTKMSVDADTIHRDGSIVSIWTKSDETANIHKEIDKDQQVFTVLDLWKFNCFSRTGVISSYVRYNVRGEVIRSFKIPEYMMVYQDIPPGSVIEAALDFACKRAE